VPDANNKLGGAKKAERKAPKNMAAIHQTIPNRRWTKSLKIKASPTTITPLGANISGATGIRQGPFSIQDVPTFMIIQFAPGIHSVNAAKKMNPSI